MRRIIGRRGPPGSWGRGVGKRARGRPGLAVLEPRGRGREESPGDERGPSEPMRDEITRIRGQNARLRRKLAGAKRSRQDFSKGGRTLLPSDRADQVLEEEVARRRKAEEALRLAEARFEAFCGFGRMAGAPVRELADFVLGEQARVTESRLGALVFLNDEENISAVYTWPGQPTGAGPLRAEPASVPVDELGLRRHHIRYRVPVIVNDCSASHPFRKALPAGESALTRFASVPAFTGDKMVAFAVVGDKQREYHWLDVRQVGLLLEGACALIERGRAERTLREKLELLELARESIIVRDVDDRIVFWSAGAAGRYGWTREEAMGQVSQVLLDTRFPMPLEEITEELFRRDRWEGDLVHRTRTGRRIAVASQWSALRDADGNGRAILEIDTDISARKRMKKELEEKSNRLQEVNAALKTLLRQRDEDRKELEDAIATNLENLVLPYLKRLKNSPLSSTQTALIEVLESHLRELTSKFIRNIVLDYRVLTPTEMRVAALVKEGKTTKEIADILCISEKTASFHRDNIRIKLGLRGKRVNLRSHLLSLP